MCLGRTRGRVQCVRADPNVEQIWEGSRVDNLSIWVIPLGRIFGALLSDRTTSNRVCPFGST
jgi:hypothetical protein